VAVELEFPRILPSASLSRGTVFVSRVDRRYRVWERAHGGECRSARSSTTNPPATASHGVKRRVMGAASLSVMKPRSQLVDGPPWRL
jgi:hypothetical protein